MTAIWQNDGTGWRLSAPVGFPDEQTLHDLVEETPQILPLAGDPTLVVVGKEVVLGTVTPTSWPSNLPAGWPSWSSSYPDARFLSFLESRGLAITTAEQEQLARRFENLYPR